MLTCLTREWYTAQQLLLHFQGFPTLMECCSHVVEGHSLQQQTVLQAVAKMAIDGLENSSQTHRCCKFVYCVGNP